MKPCFLIFLYRVVETKSKDFAVGDYVVSIPVKPGWVDHAVGNSDTFLKLDPSVPADKHSWALGILGMPGYYNYNEYADRDNYYASCYHEMQIYTVDISCCIAIAHTLTIRSNGQTGHVLQLYDYSITMILSLWFSLSL